MLITKSVTFFSTIKTPTFSKKCSCFFSRTKNYYETDTAFSNVAEHYCIKNNVKRAKTEAAGPFLCTNTKCKLRKKGQVTTDNSAT